MEFEWVYTKNNSRYAYFVLFKFPQKTLDYFDEQLKAVFFKKLYEKLKRDFVFSTVDSDRKDFSMMNEMKNLDREAYMKWFFEENETTARKREIFNETYREVFSVEFEVGN
ncbi:MAG: hypothetical protein Q4G63_12385, partial [Bacteroidia bacterium]|nr:hypothetical protein [Bacteroidia bacterium]